MSARKRTAGFYWVKYRQQDFELIGRWFPVGRQWLLIGHADLIDDAEVTVLSPKKIIKI